MKVEKLKDMLVCMGLNEYAKLVIGYIGRGDHKVSIVKEGDYYNVYTSSEKGQPYIQGEKLSENDACEEVISIFNEYKNEYEYFVRKGIIDGSYKTKF